MQNKSTIGAVDDETVTLRSQIDSPVNVKGIILWLSTLFREEPWCPGMDVTFGPFRL